MNAIWIAVAAVSLLGLAFGAILGYASRRFAVEDDPVVEKIDEILPQSQCGQCGYPGCRPYAEAISCNGEKINRCAPGCNEMQCVGHGSTHKLQPVQRSLITVCMARVAPTMASTGHA